MKDRYTAYVKQVGHELDLPRRQKEELLRGLRSELEERFAETTPSEETLLNDVGQPEDVACTLLMGVDLKERKRHSFYRLFHLCLAVAILSLLLALSIGVFCYFDASRVVRGGVTITEDSAFIQHPTDMNDE